MRESRGVLHDLTWLTAAQIAAQLLNVAVLIYLARALGSHWFGVVQVGVAVAAYALITAEWGLMSLGIREVARLDRITAVHYYARIHMGLLLILAFIVFAAGLLVLPRLSFYANDPWVFIFYLAAVMPQVYMQDWIGVGLERMTWVAVTKTSRSLIYAALILLLLGHLAAVSNWPLHRWVPVIFLLSFSGSDLVMAAAVTRWLGRPVWPTFDAWSEWRRRLKETGAIGASIMTMRMLWNIDIILLGFLAVPSAVGNYAAAAKIVFILVIAMEVLWQALLPRMSRLAKVSPEKFSTRFNFYLVFVTAVLLPAAMVGIVLGPRVVAVLYGAEYAETAVVFQILCLSYCLLALGWHFGNTLIAADRQRAYFPPLFVSAIVALVGNLWLVPKWGGVGSAWAMLIAHSMLFLMTAIVCRSYFDRILLRPVAAIMALLFVMYVLMRLSLAWPLILQMSLMVVVYLCLAGPLLRWWTKAHFTHNWRD